MRIKKYVTTTIKEALVQIKQELGENAVILHSKKVKQGGIRDLLSREMYEVTAAVDETDQPSSIKNQLTADRNQLKPQRESEPVNWKSVQTMTQLNSEVQEIKSTIREMAQQFKHQQAMPLPMSLTKLYQTLLHSGINEKTAQDFIQKIYADDKKMNSNEEPQLLHDLKDAMAEKIVTLPFANKSAGRKPYVIALVGPTGVGKTTSIAKMATHPQIYGKYRVAFISSDTYRIAAIEQLRTFAKIAEIPLEVIYSTSEIRQVFQRHHEKDIILIDMPGRSPSQQQHLLEMKQVIEAAQPDEIHLVLSITTRHEDLLDTIKEYRKMHINRLLFTKLDETKKPGTIFNVMDFYNTPISFITNGQEVPDDIRIAKTNDIVNLIFERSVEYERPGAKITRVV